MDNGSVGNFVLAAISNLFALYDFSSSSIRSEPCEQRRLLSLHRAFKFGIIGAVQF